MSSVFVLLPPRVSISPKRCNCSSSSSSFSCCQCCPPVPLFLQLRRRKRSPLSSPPSLPWSKNSTERREGGGGCNYSPFLAGGKKERGRGKKTERGGEKLLPLFFLHRLPAPRLTHSNFCPGERPTRCNPPNSSFSFSLSFLPSLFFSFHPGRQRRRNPFQ